MDYNYMSTAQINSLDYWSLVNILVYQITPEIRSKVLKRLVEMNDRLIINGNNSFTNLPINISESQVNHTDPSRMTSFNSKKKDLSENKHMYMDTGYINQPSLSNNNYHNVVHQMPKKNPMSISIDDIIDDIIEDSPQEDDLDMKLAKIARLYDKVKTNKRKKNMK